jgi:hypothetical protein
LPFDQPKSSPKSTKLISFSKNEIRVQIRVQIHFEIQL